MILLSLLAIFERNNECLLLVNIPIRYMFVYSLRSLFLFTTEETKNFFYQIRQIHDIDE